MYNHVNPKFDGETSPLFLAKSCEIPIGHGKTMVKPW